MSEVVLAEGVSLSTDDRIKGGWGLTLGGCSLIAFLPQSGSLLAIQSVQECRSYSLPLEHGKGTPSMLEKYVILPMKMYNFTSFLL